MIMVIKQMKYSMFIILTKITNITTYHIHFVQQVVLTALTF